MNTEKKPRKLYMRDMWAMKQRGEKVIAACPWDYNSAQMAEEAGAHVIGAGGGTAHMMIGGRPNALGASMEEVLFLARTIAPAVKRAVVLIAMPYGSFQISDEQAVENAIKLVKAGAECVKAQVPTMLLSRAEAIVRTEIPFMGHVGLMPQVILKRGGFRIYGKTAEQARSLFEECKRLEEVGAMAIEMECVTAPVAAEIAKRLSVPIWGIGSGNGTDGQMVVLVDVLGLQRSLSLSFVKKYADLWPLAIDALNEAVEEVATSKFPNEEHSFPINDEEFLKFMDYLESDKQRYSS